MRKKVTLTVKFAYIERKTKPNNKLVNLILTNIHKEECSE